MRHKENTIHWNDKRSVPRIECHLYTKSRDQVNEWINCSPLILQVKSASEHNDCFQQALLARPAGGRGEVEHSGFYGV